MMSTRRTPMLCTYNHRRPVGNRDPVPGERRRNIPANVDATRSGMMWAVAPD